MSMGDRSWAALAWLGLSAAGCSDPTQITLLIASDECARNAGATVTSITVGDPPNIEANQPSAVTTQCASDSGTIGSLVLVPSGADTAAVEIRVVLGVGAGTDPSTCLAPGPSGAPAYGPGCIVARRIVTYVPHQNVIVPVEMLGACDTTLGRACAADATCVDGACVPATIPDPTQCTNTTACTLTAPDGGADAAPSDGGARDSSIDTNPTLPDAGQPIDAAGCSADAGCYQVPTGWALAGFGTTGSCPSGFTDGGAVVADPTTSQESCVAGPCAMGAAPTCSVSAKAFGGCNAPVGTSGCQGVPSFLRFQATQLSASVSAVGGSCTQTATANPILSNARICTTPSASICANGICHESAFAPFTACIIAPGAQTCPTGWGFDTRHLIGAAATYTCTDPKCQLTASCGGSVVFYSDQQCHSDSQVGSFTADGTCQGIPGQAAVYQVLTQGPTSIMCMPGLVTTPSAIALMGEQTVCCAP
jgi:hypothetical protein